MKKYFNNNSIILALLVYFFLGTQNSFSAIPGDVNNSGEVDLIDSLQSLQVLSSASTGGIDPERDIDGDGKIGLAEAVKAVEILLPPPVDFPIIWPFPYDTDIRGIVYIDHNQKYKFRPFYNDNNGKGSTYFCEAPNSMPQFSHMYGEKGEFLVGITDGHRGNDYFIPAGTPIVAAADGTVIIENGNYIERDMVKIVHNNGWITLYAHSIVRDVSLHKRKVKAGDQIATIADTGAGGSVIIDNEEYFELHFEIYRPTNYYDPNYPNQPSYTSLDPYYGNCSNELANPDRSVYFYRGAPLQFIEEYFTSD